MSDDIKFCDAQRKNTREICALRAKIWQETYPNPALGIDFDLLDRSFGFTHKNTINTVDHMLNHMRDEYHCSVALDKNQIIGFAIIAYRENKIEAMNIAKTYRSSGIGSQFLHYILNMMDHQRHAILHVVAYNQRAIDFYIKNDFLLMPALWEQAYIDFPLDDDEKTLPLRGLYYKFTS